MLSPPSLVTFDGTGLCYPVYRTARHSQIDATLAVALAAECAPVDTALLPRAVSERFGHAVVRTGCAWATPGSALRETEYRHTGKTTRHGRPASKTGEQDRRARSTASA